MRFYEAITWSRVKNQSIQINMKANKWSGDIVVIKRKEGGGISNIKEAYL